MNSNDNSINLPSDLTEYFIKILFNKYTEHHKDDNSISTYPFITIRLLSINNLTAKLPIVKDLNKEFQSYGDSQLIDVVLNSLIQKDLLKENQAGRFYLTPVGYRLGLKKTNTFKFWNKYYPHVIYPTTGAFIASILGGLISA